MKPEPLEGKECNVTYAGFTKNHNVFLKADVKSAVEWFKIEMKKYYNKKEWSMLDKKINEAFPDLK